MFTSEFMILLVLFDVYQNKRSLTLLVTIKKYFPVVGNITLVLRPPGIFPTMGK